MSENADSNPIQPKDLDSDVKEQIHIQWDTYGIKGQAKTNLGPGGEAPRTWQEVWERVQHHFRRICVDLPGGVADTLSAVRAVVQGIGKIALGAARLPSALAKRVSRSHAIVETIEDQKQQAAIDNIGSETSPNLSAPVTGAKRLHNKLAELRSKGLNAHLIEQEDGTWLIVLLPPEALSDDT